MPTEKIHHLKHHKELFEKSFECSSVGKGLLHLDGSYFYVNKTFGDIIGYAPEEMESLNFKKITHPDDLEKDLNNVQRLLAGEIKSFQMEKRYIHKEGHTVWVLLNASLIREDDNTPLYFICEVQDITSLKKTEQELKTAKDHAEEATRLKDKFLSLVAHDLRGPTNSISRLLDFIIQDLSGQLAEEKMKTLRMIKNGLKKMGILIDDLLSLSRIKTGLLKPKLQINNLGEITTRVIESFTPEAKQKRIKLINNISKPGKIFTDHLLLEHILENLISNAIKFSHAGDTVTLSLTEGEKIIFAITDTGTGIPPVIAENIFRYDQKTSLLGTSGEQGSGLGLPLSKEIVKALNGDLTFESAQGQGSTFYVALPNRLPKVLVVDDEEIFRLEQRIYFHQIHKLEISIVEASNGIEALAQIEREKPNLVITDISMPVMDGFTLLEKIRENPETAEMPVIVVTALTGMDIKDKAFRKGASDFLQKPLNPDDLLPRVKRFLF